MKIEKPRTPKSEDVSEGRGRRQPEMYCKSGKAPSQEWGVRTVTRRAAPTHPRLTGSSGSPQAMTLSTAVLTLTTNCLCPSPTGNKPASCWNGLVLLASYVRFLLVPEIPEPLPPCRPPSIFSSTYPSSYCSLTLDEHKSLTSAKYTSVPPRQGGFSDTPSQNTTERARLVL